MADVEFNKTTEPCKEKATPSSQVIDFKNKSDLTIDILAPMAPGQEGFLTATLGE